MGIIERIAQLQAEASAEKTKAEVEAREVARQQRETQREAHLKFEAEAAEIASLLEVVGAKEQLEKARAEVWGEGVIEVHSSAGYYLSPEDIEQFYTGYQLRIAFQRLEESIEWYSNFAQDKWGLPVYTPKTGHHITRNVPHEAHLSITVRKGNKLNVGAFIDSPQHDTKHILHLSGEVRRDDLQGSYSMLEDMLAKGCLALMSAPELKLKAQKHQTVKIAPVT